MSRRGAEGEEDQNQSVPVLSRVSSERVQMDVISGNFPWALSCRSLGGYLEDLLPTLVGG